MCINKLVNKLKDFKSNNICSNDIKLADFPAVFFQSV